MKILVAADGSPFTKRMLAYLAAHDEWLGGAHAVHRAAHRAAAVPPRAAAVLDKQVLKDYYDDEARRSSSRSAPSSTSRASRRPSWPRWARRPTPSRRLADKGKFDLLMMGSHGHGTLTNLVMGSVATKVLANCSTPVLLRWCAEAARFAGALPAVQWVLARPQAVEAGAQHPVDDLLVAVAAAGLQEAGHRVAGAAKMVYSTTSGGSVGSMSPSAWACTIHSPSWSLELHQQVHVALLPSSSARSVEFCDGSVGISPASCCCSAQRAMRAQAVEGWRSGFRPALGQQLQRRVPARAPSRRRPGLPSTRSACRGWPWRCRHRPPPRRPSSGRSPFRPAGG
jgi:nucleotide-binding universal stress UspA family protein